MLNVIPVGRQVSQGMLICVILIAYTTSHSVQALWIQSCLLSAHRRSLSYLTWKTAASLEDSLETVRICIKVMVERSRRVILSYAFPRVEAGQELEGWNKTHFLHRIELPASKAVLPYVIFEKHYFMQRHRDTSLTHITPVHFPGSFLSETHRTFCKVGVRWVSQPLEGKVEIVYLCQTDRAELRAGNVCLSGERNNICEFLSQPPYSSTQYFTDLRNLSPRAGQSRVGNSWRFGNCKA